MNLRDHPPRSTSPQHRGNPRNAPLLPLGAERMSGACTEFGRERAARHDACGIHPPCARRTLATPIACWRVHWGLSRCETPRGPTRSRCRTQSRFTPPRTLGGRRSPHRRRDRVLSREDQPPYSMPSPAVEVRFESTASASRSRASRSRGSPSYGSSTPVRGSCACSGGHGPTRPASTSCSSAGAASS